LLCLCTTSPRSAASPTCRSWTCTRCGTSSSAVWHCLP
jgi:hypothetical protein